jgi:hypothetical protein
MNSYQICLTRNNDLEYSMSWSHMFENQYFKLHWRISFTLRLAQTVIVLLSGLQPITATFLRSLSTGITPSQSLCEL